MPISTRLLPMDVAARVVEADTAVPLLPDAPFAATGVLEAGVHVHWALPDALTHASTSDSHLPWFRGVPDQWLVTRFNPVVADRPRSYRAWVVDSIDETATPLEQWTPPDRPAELVHTAPGTLKLARAGWGAWDGGTAFDALTTAYYPACRRRLGFHDDLADLGGPGAVPGTISYTVVGWYSRLELDPFHADGTSRVLRIGHRPDLVAYTSLSTQVSAGADLHRLDWIPELRIDDLEVRDAEANTLRAAAGLGRRTLRQSRRRVSELVDAIGLAPDSPQHAVVDAVTPDTTRTETVCHGSVMDVPLRPFALTGFDTLEHEGVHLYPNLQRALAEVAARPGTTVQTDHLDMMLGSLGQQSGSTQGVVDLPGAQHARTFQSVPGSSRFYARLEIRPRRRKPVSHFLLQALDGGSGVASSGSWPLLEERSALRQFGAVQPPLIAAGKLDQPPAAPAGPSDAEVVAWITTVREAFADARQVAAAAGRTLDPRLVRVQDFRSDAQPTSMGRSADGTGPGQAGWWLDLDPEAPIDIVDNPAHRLLAELRRSVGGAEVHLPDAAGVFEVPGPRWYRPWAPHLVIYRANRSYRHGMDGRFRTDGHLSTRFGGEVLAALRVGETTVLARDLISADGLLTTEGYAASGVPAVAAGLLGEHLLADAENAPIMAAVARASDGGGAVRGQRAETFTAAARALWLSRTALVDTEQQEAIRNVAPVGQPGSAAGLQAWRDWYGPLFLDTAYTHRRKRFNDAFALPPEFIEAVDRTPAVPPDAEQTMTERQVATVTIGKVLKDSLVTQVSIDPYGQVVVTHPPPDELTEDMFDQIDIVSASLAGLDEQRLAAGEHELGGLVHLDKVTVFDSFGTPATWQAPVPPDLFTLPTWAVALPARLSTWGRLSFRLQSATDPTAEADQLTPPICGILLPDFVDQALEVYDANGEAVGQVHADDPYRGVAGQPDRALAVVFTPLPWLATGLAAGDDPTSVVQNATLRRLVQALVAAGLPADADLGPGGWRETGFTAMMRVFDTVRSTLDPAFRPDDTRVRLLGEPVVVMNVRLGFEASASSVTDLKHAPTTIADTEALPVLRVRLGDVTRPDDGVLGCLVVGATPADDRFAPVSAEAVSDAMCNQLVFGSGGTKQAATHPFVASRVSEFDLPANTDLDTIVLADARGSLYATCGVLPRKAITLPRDFIEPAERQLEPTFRVGPLLGYERQQTLVPIMPAPQVEGMDVAFVHDEDTAFPELALPPQLPLGELPAGRVRLIEGWARLSRHGSGS